MLARENFACCGTCATAEIGDERDDSRQWRGYVYYHAQDAERIPHERQTYIGYGAFLSKFLTEDEWDRLSDAEKDSTYDRIVTELMHNEVFPVFNKRGIAVIWNQDLDTRILLQDVDLFLAV